MDVTIDEGRFFPCLLCTDRMQLLNYATINLRCQVNLVWMGLMGYLPDVLCLNEIELAMHSYSTTLCVHLAAIWQLVLTPAIFGTSQAGRCPCEDIRKEPWCCLMLLFRCCQLIHMEYAILWGPYPCKLSVLRVQMCMPSTVTKPLHASLEGRWS